MSQAMTFQPTAMNSRNQSQERRETLKEIVADRVVVDSNASFKFPRLHDHAPYGGSGQPNSQVTDTYSRWQKPREDSNIGDWMTTVFSSANRSPTLLPETIEFQTMPEEQKSGRRRKRRARQDEAYRQEGAEALAPIPTGQTEKDLLVESIYMLLYIKRSSTTIPITIKMLRDTQHPMLLTLTSYPFRVLYSNDAFQNTSGGDAMVGRTIFECFESKEDIMKPSLSMYPTFLKLLLDGRPCSMNLRHHGEGNNIITQDCTIQAENVYAVGEQVDTLHYYVIHFNVVV